MLKPGKPGAVEYGLKPLNGILGGSNQTAGGDAKLRFFLIGMKGGRNFPNIIIQIEEDGKLRKAGLPDIPTTTQHHLGSLPLAGSGGCQTGFQIPEFLPQRSFPLKHAPQTPQHRQGDDRHDQGDDAEPAVQGMKNSDDIHGQILLLSLYRLSYIPGHG